MDGHGRPLSPADLDLGRSSSEDREAFEVAEWVLGSLIAWCSARTAAERAKAEPPQASRRDRH